MSSVSILVPVRDEVGVIRETVAAMQCQRFDGELEFIFLDGSSRDGTRDILEALAVGDQRIRVLDNPERRGAQALHNGRAPPPGPQTTTHDPHPPYTPPPHPPRAGPAAAGAGAPGAGP